LVDIALSSNILSSLKLFLNFIYKRPEMFSVRGISCICFQTHNYSNFFPLVRISHL